MEEKESKYIRRFKSKYRLVILNDRTLEERFSLSLKGANIIALFSLILVIAFTISFATVFFTPLKEYIPGYGDFDTQKNIVALLKRTDSLEHRLQQKEIYTENLRKVLIGEVGDSTFYIDESQTTEQAEPSGRSEKEADLPPRGMSKEDSLLRYEFENTYAYELFFTSSEGDVEDISNYLFYPPIKGTVSSSFDETQRHFGIDIVGVPGVDVVGATLDGVVVHAEWSIETGNVIILQHRHNLISVYKHNEVLLKKVGNFVSSGEAIAILGNSGEYTTGPHLHFEIWHNGVPLNPEEFITF